MLTKGYTHTHTHTHIKRIESPEIEPHIWSIHFQKRCKDNSMDKVQSYQQYVREKMDIHLFKRMNLDPHFILYIKILTQNESKL